jgi:hypothetical protein
LYVDNIPIDKSTTAAIRTFINEVTKKHTKLEWVRKVKTPAECFGISMMVKFSNYDDKQKFVSSLDMNKTLIRLRNVNWDHDDLIYEKVHTKYCKYKYASNEACRGELGRHPISHKIWTHVVKFWLRMAQGSPNLFANHAYECAREGSHPWVQGIKYLLYQNGFGYVWQNPMCVKLQHFGKIFQQRLDSQYQQVWGGKIKSSSRFQMLSRLKENFEMSPYLKTIENVEIRNTFTRLRLDMNKLEICQGRHKNISREQRTCPNCRTNTETVQHFLLDCPTFSENRLTFSNKMKIFDTLYHHRSNEEKLNILLNVQPLVTEDYHQQSIKLICTFIKSIYDKRLQCKPG